MKIAVLMDDLRHIKPYKDTTIAMIQSAQSRGHTCAVFMLNDMVCRQNHIYASLLSLSIGDVHAKQWVKTSALGEKPLADYDVVIMRKDPPFDMEYIYATYMLDRLEQEGVLVSNKPQSLRDANEKFFTTHFPSCCQPLLVTRNMTHLREFWETHRDVVFKPLEGMGGNSVFRVDASASNLSVILEVLTHSQTRTIMAQKYIPEIATMGDKRILMVHGVPIPFALARIPAQGELRGNLAAGATGHVVPLTPRDEWICQQLSPTLIAKGLHFVGIDVIGDYLTEINVTSPTCAREISESSGIDVTGAYIEGLEALVP